ncbi:centromere protein P-like [Bombina bombina]|uniref:centromere protein P-like n=1 Tax=Bombina bombina TaxID=8345 RepID=UPI00235A77E5|nr:centromere protein P-like [Bombina bombina]
MPLREKYSDAVGIPVGLSAEYIVLKNPKLPGCELVIVWKINVNEEGAVIPVFDLLNKIPEQALPFDKMKILQNTSIGFRNLLQVYGIEGSIEKLVRVFCLTEE